MRPRTLLLLVAATLAAAMLAWLLQRTPGEAGAGALLLPGLAQDLNSVSMLVVEPAGTEEFHIERGAEGWQVPARDGYPADPAMVARLVRRLAEARVIEPKTSNPTLHDRLGVELMDGRPGSGVLLTLEGVAGLPRLVIGQSETRGLRGTYVRRAGEPLALLVDQDLQPGRAPLDWLQREVLDIAPEAIASIEIVQADGVLLQVDRDELGIFRIASLPEGRQPSGPTAAEALGRALTDLRLDEVRSASGWSAGDPDAVARFQLADGRLVEARTWRGSETADDSGPWVALSVEGEDPSGILPAGGDLSRWLFRFPAWKHEQLARRLEDLLAPAAE